jgi:hypothetical protein
LAFAFCIASLFVAFCISSNLKNQDENHYGFNDFHLHEIQMEIVFDFERKEEKTKNPSWGRE